MDVFLTALSIFIILSVILFVIYTSYELIIIIRKNTELRRELDLEHKERTENFYFKISVLEKEILDINTKIENLARYCTKINDRIENIEKTIDIYQDNNFRGHK